MQANVSQSPIHEQTKPYQYYTVGIFDTDGLFLGKKMHPNKFLSAKEKGFSFCNVVFGWDIDDKLYNNTTMTGWHTGYPDLHVELDMQSTRDIPFDPLTQLVIGQATGTMSQICPRAVLSRVVQRAKEMGLLFKAAFEYEFFVFDETPESVREKGYQNLKPYTPGAFGYSVLRSGAKHEFQQSLWSLCEAMRFPLEGLHTETGPGVLEAALCVADPIEACDRAGLFKTYTKILAQRQNLMATFMARWSTQEAGQSGHIHVSCTDLEGNPLFHKENGFSPLMLHFLAGVQHYMPEYTALFAPTINSYARLKPGFWAPTSPSWGIENRTCAIRAIPGNPESTRMEFRAAGADCNPYLALAAILSAGLEGVAKKMTPQDAIEGNAYEVKTTPLPTHLLEATQRLKESSMIADYCSQAFVNHFVQTREWECNQYFSSINDWQLARYFEAI